MVDNPRPCFCLGSPDTRTTNSKTKRIKHKRKAKRAAGIEGQVATMLELHTIQVDTVDTTTIKRARKNEKRNLEETKQKCRLGTASNEITGGGGGGFN